MATRALGLITLNRTSECDVGIGLEPGGKTPKVSRKLFWVSKSQKDLLQWFCQRGEVEPGHVHGKDSPCFTVIFDKDGTPFESSDFTSNDRGYACSDNVVVEPNEARLYHYRIIMKGKEPLDPGGGVKP